MEKKLKIGIVGLGGILNYAHMPAYLRMNNIEINAVCDCNPDKIKKFKERYNMPDVPSFKDYNDLVKCKNIDAVDICTPNYLHSEISVAAFENGLHVMCEKPDAISVEEALKMKEASEKAGKTLMVMRNNRYRATAKYLKQFIKDGKMGDIYAGRCGWIRRRGIPGKGGWFTTKALSGGGPLIDLGVHMIDLSIWLMGNPKPVSVSGCTFCKFANSDASDSVNSNFGEKKSDGTFDVEDLAMGFIRFENGACLQIEFSWASNVEREDSFVELRGTKAGTKFTASSAKVKIFTEDYGQCIDYTPVSADDYKCMQHHEANLRHFADVVLNGAKPDFEPIQGVNMIKILQAMYKSAELGKEISLLEE